jgi:hypothetical protein
MFEFSALATETSKKVPPPPPKTIIYKIRLNIIYMTFHLD